MAINIKISKDKNGNNDKVTMTMSHAEFRNHQRILSRAKDVETACVFAMMALHPEIWCTEEFTQADAVHEFETRTNMFFQDFGRVGQ